jgi:formyl-CoA transferase/CoA:oxalate CoA-transferase
MPMTRDSRPLTGVRVLDLARMLTGDYASMLLGDMGAEVIKIEEVDGGDPLRKMPPHFIEGESAYFLSINRNKKSVAIDLRHPKGREVLDRLAASCDVMIDNFRPGVLDRLGCGHERMRGVNPRLILCSITSFGTEGPMRDMPAFDLTLQAWSGAMSVTGEAGRAPARLGIPLGDLSGGIYAAVAICAALVRRERTGQGGTVDLSLLDCLTAMHTYAAQYYFADGRVPGPQGSSHMSVVPYGAFAVADGWIVIGIFTERFWEAFCRALDHLEWAHDPRYESNPRRVANRDVLEESIREVLAGRPSGEWLERLHAAGIPAAPILTLDRTLALDPLLRRGMVTSYRHPVAGEVRTLGDPVMRRAPAPAPLLGEHTEALLVELAGFNQQEVAGLRQEGVVR